MADDFADYPGPAPRAPQAPAPLPSFSGRDRRVPYDEEAEQAVLGACLMDARAYTKAAEVINDTSFYREGHRRIWRAMASLVASGAPLEVLALRDRLQSEGQLEAAGGTDYLAQLVGIVATAANVTYHAGLIKKTHARRLIIEAATDAITAAYEGPYTAAQIAQQITAALLPLSVDDATRAGFQRVDPYAVLEEISRRTRGEEPAAYPTGLACFDREAMGTKPGELYFIAAAPKVGKSVLAIQWAVQQARAGHGVGIVSAEIGATQATERMLNHLSGVGGRATMAGRVSNAEGHRLLKAASTLADLRLWIDDTARPSWQDVRARTVALKSANPDVAMIVIDFLQLVRFEMKGRRGDEELSAMAYEMKGLAKELAVSMIVPCQLNYKDIEKRPDKRPELHDLQGSSGMAQAADMVILLYRPMMYFMDQAPRIELIVPAGGTRRTHGFTASAWWRGDTFRIADTEFDPIPPDPQIDLLDHPNDTQR